MEPDPSPGRLTVHVLDTALGRPAAGLPFSLFRIGKVVRSQLGAWRTNEDGRCDGPLLEGAALTAGSYEIVFNAGGWREMSGASDAGFYDLIPIRFRVTDTAVHYHVPLLLSPYGYSTYRGG
jgi:5-hydroxyisourate hydrolase